MKNNLYKKIFLWSFFFLIILFQNLPNNILNYIDIIFIIGFILMLYNKEMETIVFIFLFSFIKDLLFYPYIGFNLVSNLLALIIIKILNDNLFKENYLTQVIIFSIALFIKKIIYILVISIFYWEKNYIYMPIEFFLEIILTILVAIILLKIISFSGKFKWAKVKF